MSISHFSSPTPLVKEIDVNFTHTRASTEEDSVTVISAGEKETVATANVHVYACMGEEEGIYSNICDCFNLNMLHINLPLSSLMMTVVEVIPDTSASDDVSVIVITNRSSPST